MRISGTFDAKSNAITQLGDDIEDVQALSLTRESNLLISGEASNLVNSAASTSAAFENGIDAAAFFEIEIHLDLTGAIAID